MLKEFDNGQAVVVDGAGNVLWQLVAIKKTRSGKTDFAVRGLADTYPTKKQAAHAARLMGVNLANVTEGHNIVSIFWYIKYDPRYEYAHACWEV